jgi:hypothetical protein
VRPAPGAPAWEGPITDPTVLEAQVQGTVAIDDVGTIRQRRYSNSVMEGGWTMHGCSPLTSVELVRDGRPVWLLQVGGAPG